MKTKNIFLAAVMGMMTLVSTSASAMGNTGETGLPAQTETQANPIKVNVNKQDKVDAQSTDIYTLTLYADMDADIYVTGDGDTDLDIYLYDENGNLIDSHTDSTDVCHVHCCPKWTGTFKLMIKNLGEVYNSYRLRIIQ